MHLRNEKERKLQRYAKMPLHVVDAVIKEIQSKFASAFQKKLSQIMPELLIIWL
ncbi:hypothetical protein ACJX0J_020283, partial [Zea mays]